MESNGMGCYKHEDRKVVATCKNCGKFMCKECANKYESKLCEDCESERVAKNARQYQQQKDDLKARSKENLKENKKRLIKVAIISIIFAVIGIMAGSDSGAGSSITFAYMFAALPWGWKVVKDAIDLGDWAWASFLTNSGGLFIFGIFFKFVLAMIIGLVAMPVEIIKAIVYYSKAKKLDNDISKM
jgi:hypothetical protein